MSKVSIGSVVAASVLAVALSVDTTTAARAAEPGAGGSDVVVGDFGLGDGLEGGIDPRLGSFEFQVVAGGVAASWNSSRAGDDRYELGPGWSWHTAGIDVDGEVRVFPTSGGVFPASMSSPSGLLGYHERDLVFEQRPDSRLAARADGSVGERDYAYVLHELGGVTTYFTREGHPAASVGPTGERMDWEWDPAHPDRLIGVVNADGVRTELDWDAMRNGIVVRPAANVAKRDASAGVGDWRILLRNDTIDAVVDPLGGRVDIEMSSTGLVERLDTPSGATTEIEWTPRDDGSAQVGEVRVSDDSGVLSRRRWSQTAGPLASGWPAHSAGVSATGAVETELSDGKTRVVSEFNDLGLLIDRKVIATTASGERSLQEQSFAYPSTDANGSPTVAPDDLPANWSRPTTTTVVHRDASGAERESTQHMTYDDFGRVVRALDGTRYAYDATNRLIEERTPEGETITTAYWADGARKQLSSVASPGAATQSTTFYWDGGTLVNETHAGSAEAGERGTASYLVGQIRHARTTVDESGHRATRYSSTDRHGNVTALTDEAGAQTLQYAYSDYGVTTTTRADGSVVDDEPWVGQLGYSPFQYANEQTDGGQRQYLRARMLDLETARFLTKDSAARQNLFNFADLNPITNVDPSGRSPELDLAMAFAGVALALGGLIAAPFSGGSSLLVAGTAAIALVDTAMASLTAYDYFVDVIPDTWSNALSIASMVTGAASAALSFGAYAGFKLGQRAASKATRAAANVIEQAPGGPATPPGSARSSRSNSVGPQTIEQDPVPTQVSPQGLQTNLDAAPNGMSVAQIEQPQQIFPVPLQRTNTTPRTSTTTSRKSSFSQKPNTEGTGSSPELSFEELSLSGNSSPSNGSANSSQTFTSPPNPNHTPPVSPRSNGQEIQPSLSPPDELQSKKRRKVRNPTIAEPDYVDTDTPVSPVQRLGATPVEHVVVDPTSTQVVHPKYLL